MTTKGKRQAEKNTVKRNAIYIYFFSNPQSNQVLATGILNRLKVSFFYVILHTGNATDLYSRPSSVIRTKLPLEWRSNSTRFFQDAAGNTLPLWGTLNASYFGKRGMRDAEISRREWSYKFLQPPLWPQCNIFFSGFKLLLTQGSRWLGPFCSS